MKQNLYGKKMFIIDLILVSIWALFFSRYSTPGLLLLIPARIALSFEMQRKTPWTLVSAIGFIIAYSCINNSDEPSERMFFNFFCAIGESKQMITIFSKPFEWGTKAWINTISTVWYIWLAVLPVVVGICLHNITQIRWKKKWIWIYLLPSSIFCMLTMINVGITGFILLGLVIVTLPVVYWSIYDRHGRSPIQLLLKDRNIGWYVLYTLLFLSAITIGLKDISSMKLIGLIIFPAVFYILLTVSLRLGTILIRCCIALSLSGWLYWLTFDTDKTGTIVLLSLAIGLIIFAGVTMIVKTKNRKASLALMLIVPTIIIPGTLGLNPYVVIDADYTRMYLSNISVRNGVYVVERYLDKCDSVQLYYYGRKYGLRDRYGIILPMEYDELKAFDRYGQYIATISTIHNDSLKSGQRYGVFDLRNRTFVVNPQTLDVSDLIKIDNKSFKLINADGRHFATLYLPGEYQGVYFPDAHVEPHTSDETTDINQPNR